MANILIVDDEQITLKLLQEFLELVGWDTAKTIPSEDSLQELGLEFLISDLS